MFFGLFFIPQYIRVVFIPIVYVAVINLIFAKKQEVVIKNHLCNGEYVNATFRDGVFSALSGLVIFVVFIALMTISHSFYGFEKCVSIDRNINLYYSKVMGNRDARIIAKTIDKSGFFKKTKRADIFLDSEDSVYNLRFVIVDTAFLSDTFFIYNYNTLEKIINTETEIGMPLKISFLDTYLVNEYTLKKIDLDQYTTISLCADLKTLKVSSKHMIYYDKTVSENMVKNVEETMKNLPGYFPRRQMIDLVILNTKPTYTIQLFVPKNQWRKKEVIQRIKLAIQYIELGEIDRRIEIVLIDPNTQAQYKVKR